MSGRPVGDRGDAPPWPSGRTRVAASDATAGPPRPPGFGVLVIGLLVVLNGLALWGILRAVDQRSWVGFGVIVVCTALVDVVYATRRFIPAKYLLPGSIFLVLFAVLPVIYTVYLSFTNYGTGHLITKPQAIAQIEANSLQPFAGGDPLSGRHHGDAGRGALPRLLTDPSGAYFTGQSGTLEPADPTRVQTNESGTVTGYDDATALTVIEKSDLSQEEKDALAVTTDTGLVQLTSLTEAAELEQRFQYDSDRGVMVDATNGIEYEPVEGTFTNPDADPAALDPGWTVGIGFDNYKELFTDRRSAIRSSRCSSGRSRSRRSPVATSFALGLLLAMVFANERMKGRRTYRVLLILPYALPTFMTILVWQGMMNTDFGILNEILHTNINWLGDPWWARVLRPARQPVARLSRTCSSSARARCRASRPTSRRRRSSTARPGSKAFRRVTFPLLLIAVAPVLIASFAFNFNNYNLIHAAHRRRSAEARPDRRPDRHPDHATRRRSRSAGAGVDYGLATAISAIIFIIVAIISSIGFRFTRAYEEVR